MISWNGEVREQLLGKKRVGVHKLRKTSEKKEKSVERSDQGSYYSHITG